MKIAYKSQFWIFLLFCTYLSLIPAPPETLQTYPDKLLHATGYLALYLSCALSYARQITWGQRAALLFAYSIGIEILQHFIPRRAFSMADILANAVGLTAGIILTAAVKKTGLFRA